MKKIIDYVILNSSTIGGLEWAVVSATKHGWEPQGVSHILVLKSGNTFKRW